MGWRVEVGGQDAKAMYICETPCCGITYFDARCFVLHLEAHGAAAAGGFVQEGEADSMDAVAKEEAMRLLDAWNAERHGHVKDYRNWREGIDEHDDNVPQSHKMQQKAASDDGENEQARPHVSDGTEKLVLVDQAKGSKDPDAPQSQKQKAASDDVENEQLVLELESADQARGRKRKKNATAEKARMAMLHFGRARWKLLAKPKQS